MDFGNRHRQDSTWETLNSKIASELYSTLDGEFLKKVTNDEERLPKNGEMMEGRMPPGKLFTTSS